MRDLYYTLPLPAPVRWAARNALVRLVRGASGPSWFRTEGPWTATLAASRRVPFDSEEVRAVLADPARISACALPQHPNPVVSVVIPVHNKVEYTLACLLSIIANLPAVPFEVIVVDDASSDATTTLLPRFAGLRYVRNEANLGFIGSCNRGADVAAGEFVCFLNNDTNVLRGWLDEMHWTFTHVPGVGVVGSKLVFPDNTLQECGGILWRDGSAWNYARTSQPDDPRTSYLRDADYVSGASLMVARAVFRELGGFDPLYTPAYYEDSDLAFRMRARGLRVLVQPASMVVHYEGVTSGRDLTQGPKRYQVTNQAKFYERWKETLSEHGEHGERPERNKERLVAKRLLMLDISTPEPDRDAGSVTADHFLSIFQRLGYKVTFAAENLRYDARYTARLQRRGVECLYHPYYVHLRQLLRRRGGEFDVVVISRPHVAGPLLRLLRRHCGKARIIYNTVDLHWIREARQAEVEGSYALSRRALKTRKMELRSAAAADVTIVLSAEEKAILGRELPTAQVEVIPLVLQEEPAGPPAQVRSGMVFIGGWRHTPNADALRHFVLEILPQLRAGGWGEPLYVIGERSDAELSELASPGVEMLGRIEDIRPWFERARCMVVPLRYGAGVKGKIGSAFAYGLPVISTPVGAEGMELVPERDYLSASSAAEWSAQLRRVADDAALWQRLSDAGRRIVRERYSPALIAQRLGSIIAP